MILRWLGHIVSKVAPMELPQIANVFFVEPIVLYSECEEKKRR